MCRSRETVTITCIPGFLSGSEVQIDILTYSLRFQHLDWHQISQAATKTK